MGSLLGRLPKMVKMRWIIRNLPTRQPTDSYKRQNCLLRWTCFGHGKGKLQYALWQTCHHGIEVAMVNQALTWANFPSVCAFVTFPGRDHFLRILFVSKSIGTTQRRCFSGVESNHENSDRLEDRTLALDSWALESSWWRGWPRKGWPCSNYYINRWSSTSMIFHDILMGCDRAGLSFHMATCHTSPGWFCLANCVRPVECVNNELTMPQRGLTWPLQKQKDRITPHDRSLQISSVYNVRCETG